MQNVTELYRKHELPNKLSPGNFLRNKEFKNIIDDDDYKKEESEYFFNKKTYDMYITWADIEPEVEAKEMKEEFNSKTNEAFLKLCDKIGETNAIDYVNKIIKFFIVDQSYTTLCLKFDDDKPLKYAAGNFDKCMSIYLGMIYSYVDLAGSLQRNEVRNICQDLHKTFNSMWVSKFHDNVCFSRGKEIWITGVTNKLVYVLKD